MKPSPMFRRTWSRTSLKGEIALTITPTPLRVNKSATKPILKTLVSLSSLEKPRPLDRLVLTMSPSRTSILRKRFLSSCSTISDMVVLPAPDKPVNHNVKPRPNLVPFSIVNAPRLLITYCCHFNVFLTSWLRPLPLNEHFDDFGAGELGGWVLALGEHLAHLRTADKHVVHFIVGAGLGGPHTLTLQAEEGMFEEEWGQPDLPFLELIEDVLGVVVTVERPAARVLAWSGMVTAYDKVCAAVVLAADRVEDSLPRSTVAHRRGEDGQQRPILRIVALQDRLVGAHPDVGGDVRGASLAHERVQEQPVDYLEGALLDILVRAVHGVTGLETDDALPAFLREDLAQAARLVVVGRERLRVGVVHEQRYLATEKHVLLAVDGCDARMLGVRRTVDLAGFVLFVVGVAVLDDHGRKNASRIVCEGDLLTDPYAVCLLLARGECDRQAPGQTVLEVHGLHDALVVLTDHETREGREDAGGEHLQVGESPRTQGYPGEALGPAEQLVALVLGRPAVDELAAVWRDGSVLRADVHPFTSARIVACPAGSLRNRRPARPAAQWSQGRSPTTQSLNSPA